MNVKRERGVARDNWARVKAGEFYGGRQIDIELDDFAGDDACFISDADVEAIMGGGHVGDDQQGVGAAWDMRGAVLPLIVERRCAVRDDLEPSRSPQGHLSAAGLTEDAGRFARLFTHVENDQALR